MEKTKNILVVSIGSSNDLNEHLFRGLQSPNHTIEQVIAEKRIFRCFSEEIPLLEKKIGQDEVQRKIICADMLVLSLSVLWKKSNFTGLSNLLKPYSHISFVGNGKKYLVKGFASYKGLSSIFDILEASEEFDTKKQLEKLLLPNPELADKKCCIFMIINKSTEKEQHNLFSRSNRREVDNNNLCLNKYIYDMAKEIR